MNPQTLIEALREAMIANQTHEAILGVAVAAIPVLLVLWIIHRMRHRERSFLGALGISVFGLVLVPCVSAGVGILWVRTGGEFNQALGGGIVLYILGFFLFRWWLRSAPRTARRTETGPPPVDAAVPEPALPGEVAALRAEVARLRAERRERTGEDVSQTPFPSIH